MFKCNLYCEKVKSRLKKRLMFATELIKLFSYLFDFFLLIIYYYFYDAFLLISIEDLV